MAQQLATETAPRLTSLDAYRGFVMLAMCSGGFAFARLQKVPEVVNAYVGTPYDEAWRRLWSFLAFQFDHVEWRGCAFWDLIQPSFMFMVGVAVPYSLARRTQTGQSAVARFLHILFRSAVLVALGVFLASAGAPETNFTFTNVLAQIGLGYWFVCLLHGRHWLLQLGTIALICAGHWYAFVQHPLPPTGFDTTTVGVPADWDHHPTGFGAHWDKNTNWAHWVDAEWNGGLLNRFWRNEKFVFNKGGYTTLNFLPSIVTMLLGLMAGELLRGKLPPGEKVFRLVMGGLICLSVGLACDPASWPVMSMDVTLCPIVKRIWTPSWAVYSSGWAYLMLAAFYWIIDVRGNKWWAFPFVVVGMNSIAIYVMAQLLKPWIKQTLLTHLSLPVQRLTGLQFLAGPYAPLGEACGVLAVLWLFCFWMYRSKIFVRI